MNYRAPSFLRFGHRIVYTLAVTTGLLAASTASASAAGAGGLNHCEPMQTRH